MFLLPIDQDEKRNYCRGPHIHHLYQLTNNLTCTFIEEVFKVSETRISHDSHVIMLIISTDNSLNNVNLLPPLSLSFSSFPQTTPWKMTDFYPPPPFFFQLSFYNNLILHFHHFFLPDYIMMLTFTHGHLCIIPVCILIKCL